MVFRVTGNIISFEITGAFALCLYIARIIFIWIHFKYNFLVLLINNMTLCGMRISSRKCAGLQTAKTEKILNGISNVAKNVNAGDHMEIQVISKINENIFLQKSSDILSQKSQFFNMLSSFKLLFI